MEVKIRSELKTEKEPCCGLDHFRWRGGSYVTDAETVNRSTFFYKLVRLNRVQFESWCLEVIRVPLRTLLFEETT